MYNSACVLPAILPDFESQSFLIYLLTNIYHILNLFYVQNFLNLSTFLRFDDIFCLLPFWGKWSLNDNSFNYLATIGIVLLWVLTYIRYVIW
jgi:hypothetical protein